MPISTFLLSLVHAYQHLLCLPVPPSFSPLCVPASLLPLNPALSHARSLSLSLTLICLNHNSSPSPFAHVEVLGMGRRVQGLGFMV